MPPPSSTSSLTVRSPEGGLLASPSPAVTTPSTNRCTHCGSVKSPLWRRGIHSEILCNACGLYWKHHGIYRPLSLAAERGGSNSVKIGRGSTFASSTRGYTDSSEATRPSATARSRAEKSSAGVSRKVSLTVITFNFSYVVASTKGQIISIRLLVILCDDQQSDLTYFGPLLTIPFGLNVGASDDWDWW